MRAGSLGLIDGLGRRLIIGAAVLVAVLALGACSAVRLGYNNGPSLASWWLDRWLDLSSVQEGALRPELQRWFDWHRAEELPVYAERIGRWRAQASGDVQGAEVCAAIEEVRGWAWRAVQAALPLAAERLPDLTDAQWDHLTARQAERLAELRREHLQPDPAARHAAALARAVERAEDLYGRLTAAQRELLAAALAASPADPERWLAERERQQAALVRGLRDAARLPLPERRAALQSLARAYFDGTAAQGWRAQWRAHTCETSARLHNSATPAQRERLRRRLQGWQEDLSALAAAAAS